MSNWQERIRQALNERDASERGRQEKVRRDREQEQREQRESESTHRKRPQEARDIFARVGAREILESARRDVWHVGIVTVEDKSDSVLAKLELERKGTNRDTWTDQGGNGRTGPDYKGSWIDRLSIEVRTGYAEVSDLRGFISGPHRDLGSLAYGFPERKLVNINSADYVKSRSELKKLFYSFASLE